MGTKIPPKITTTTSSNDYDFGNSDTAEADGPTQTANDGSNVSTEEGNGLSVQSIPGLGKDKNQHSPNHQPGESQPTDKAKKPTQTPNANSSYGEANYVDWDKIFGFKLREVALYAAALQGLHASFQAVRAAFGSALAAALRKIVGKVGARALAIRIGSAILGTALGIVAFVLNPSQLAASTPEWWRTRLRYWRGKLMNSDSPAEQLNYLRHMWLDINRVQQEADAKMRVHLLGGRQLYESNPGSRQQLITKYAEVIGAYAKSVQLCANLQKEIVETADQLKREAIKAYSWNPQLVRNIHYYEPIFQNFRRISYRRDAIAKSIRTDRTTVEQDLAQAK